MGLVASGRYGGRVPRPGTTLSNRYLLEERIASGGMGEVWRGSDPMLQRTIAVKVLLPSLVSDEEFITRFRTEARMMAALRHPGIVQVFDYGADALIDDFPRDYLVMEYIEGQPLASKIKAAGKLGPAETLAVVTQAAEALHVAHNAGIVHRDVKPTNLMVRPDGTVVLVAFGVARSIDVTGITSANLLVGSPQYMAPEQVAGKPVTATTDIYALGAVAYCCLTGRPPFTGENPVQVLAQLLHGEPAALPEDVPAAVAELVLQALTKDPAKRFPSAAALARAARSAANTAAPDEAVTEPSAPAFPALPQPVATFPSVDAPVVGWSVPPPPLSPPPPEFPAPPVSPLQATAAPATKPRAKRGGKARNAVLIAGAALLVGATVVSTSLALRSSSDSTQSQSGPSAPISAAAALDASPGADPGEAASQPRTPPPRTPSPTSTSAGANPITSPGGSPQALDPAGPTPQPAEATTTGPTTTGSTKPAPSPTPKAVVAELNHAVNSTAKRGAGPCSAKLVAGYGCYATYGDIWWVYDTKSDSHSAVVFWEVGSGSGKRVGQCVNSLGVGHTGTCNKNYTEGLTGRAKVCIEDSDTKKVWECTAYFSFKTS